MWDNVPMLTHATIWTALDTLARRHGLSPSGLARKAGLDPTTFNRSKRTSPDGTKLRWPSTESLAKAIEATGTTLADFLAVVAESGGGRATQHLPLLDLAELAQPGRLDAQGLPLARRGGLPRGGEADWDGLPFPDLQDDRAFALTVAGEMLQPVFRDGCVLVVSPRAETRRGDRVLLGRVSGEVLCRTLQRKTLTRIELAGFGPLADELSLDVQDVAWMHRIVWASQ